MKRILLISGLLCIVGLGLLFAFQTNKEYVPIIIERTELETSVASIPSQKLSNPGKIFIRGFNLFVVEQYYGVHIFNNIDPTNPVKLGFIRILGCTDVAVRGNMMYASSAVDLVTIDISDIANAKEVARNRNVLSELTSPLGTIPELYSKRNRPEGTEIIAWKTK